ncbi:MAG TPA: cupin domain-containing protein [Acidimicrobiales bacterium]|nr:cupin domain-containing protein [Acidimicrobiales bacterium]
MSSSNVIASVVDSRTAWWSLGCLMVELPRTSDTAPFVSEATLPEGASPPLHVHADLDDSFYILEGLIVLQCGDDVSLGTPGTWVPFPKGVPHTFRVLDGAARTLQIHADDSFLALVRELGEPAPALRLPTTSGGPGVEAMTRAFSAHGITNVGPSMEEGEAREYLSRLV